MLEQLLQSIGLSDKEAKCYLALLKHGTRSTSFVAKKADLNRGTTYVALHSLLEMALVSKSVKQNIQYFTAVEPEQLVNFLDRRTEEIKDRKREIVNSLSKFTALQSPLSTRPKIEYFEGAEGAITAYEDTLSSKEKTLRAFMSLPDVLDFLGGDWFDNYTERRVNQGYTLNLIRSHDKDREALKRNPEDIKLKYMADQKSRREIRYVDQELVFPVTMYMYDNKLMAISSKAENFAVIIESDELCKMQKKLFMLLWNSLG